MMKTLNFPFTLLFLSLFFLSCNRDDDDATTSNNTSNVIPPFAQVILEPLSGDVNTLFQFDATNSTDNKDNSSDLVVRWDFENDGKWETGFSSNKIVSYQYDTPGAKKVKLEIKDLDGNTTTDYIDVAVLGSSTSGPETGTMTDIEGNIYKTVKIGNQWWMAENLKVTKYRNGEQVTYITDNVTWQLDKSEGYCQYNHDASNIDKYGLIYNGYAMEDSRIIAPAGWHVPSDQEWQELEVFLGLSPSTANSMGYHWGIGEMLMETGTLYWDSPNSDATNESGFSARAGGSRYEAGEFKLIGSFAHFWTSTPYTGSGSSYQRITRSISSSTQVGRNEYGINRGCYIRCVRD